MITLLAYPVWACFWRTVVIEISTHRDCYRTLLRSHGARYYRMKTLHISDYILFNCF